MRVSQRSRLRFAGQGEVFGGELPDALGRVPGGADRVGGRLLAALVGEHPGEHLPGGLRLGYARRGRLPGRGRSAMST